MSRRIQEHTKTKSNFSVSKEFVSRQIEDNTTAIKD